MIQQFHFKFIYLKKVKTLTKKDIYIPMFNAALFIITKTQKQPNPPTDEWIKKMWCAYIHTTMYIQICIYILIYTYINIIQSYKMKSCHL